MRKAATNRHINLDREAPQIKHFLMSLPLDRGGSILELQGEPVLRVLPMDSAGLPIDKSKLKAAILHRRTVSRRVNKEWENTDREVFGQVA